MQKRTGRAATTILMTVPLAAVPLMAIFGVPQLAPQVGQQLDRSVLTEPSSQFPDGTAAGNEVILGDASSQVPAGGVAAFHGENSAPLWNTGTRPAPVEAVPASWNMQDTRPAVASTPTTSWADVERRMQDLQVLAYHIEPGDTPQTVYFVCRIADSENSRVIRQFEGEAASPVDAALPVLDRIASHRAQFGQSNLGNVAGL